MKLENRIKAGYLITVILAVIVIILLIIRFYISRKSDIYNFYISQAYHISQNIHTMVESVEFNVLSLSLNVLVKTRNDSGFTNFLNADEKKFIYKYGAEEERIIEVFSRYRKTHPYVNSVYMGRANGSFVRSHKRAEPTKYDPRERPWYKLAVKDKNSVMITEPYRAVTTEDINIGVVKALAGDDGAVYGVVGADITLEKLSDFVSGVRLIKGSHVMLVDRNGVILTGPDRDKLFKKYDDAGFEGFEAVMAGDKGMALIKGDGRKWNVFYETISRFGWKVCAFVPGHVIYAEVGGFVRILFVIMMLYIAAAFFLNRVLSKKITNPFNRLLAEMDALAKNIENKNRFSKIDTDGTDEIRRLADTYNDMGERLAEAYRDLEQNYEKLKEMDKMKTYFVSMISHELKTPLVVIEGAYNMLVKEPASPPEKRKALEKMMELNINRLRLTVADLIDASLMESGVLKLRKTRGSINRLLEGVKAHFSVIGGERRIKILTEPGGEEVQVTADMRRLEQVLFNIIGNSLKFACGDSEIFVSAEKLKKDDLSGIPESAPSLAPSNEYVLISVKDSGPGIEEKELERIFDLFYQAGDVIARKYDGIGAGLSIAKKITEAHGGLLWARSEGRDKGAEFFILLPAEA
ncbi:MAG TPA: sensor histidine kinase [bacterium]|nr:sensor histidine kinase [bacterium]